tara:strand:+ start:92 stop:505 length:414 start_codon:yes stop_codon:yes gene_type:complete
MAFKMKNFSGFGNSPMKQKGRFGIAGLSSSEKSKFFNESKARAKEAFKRDAAKSGHGTIEDLKAKSLKRKTAKKISKKPEGMLGRVAKAFGVKQAAKRIGLLGAAITAYDIAKTAKKAIPGLKRRAKSGNVNIGRKI